MKKIVSLQDINIKNSPVVRAEIRADIVEEYAQCYQFRAIMPPVCLFDVDGSYLIADGRHRCEAMIKAGIKQALFDITRGTFDDCFKAALMANIKHGLRRSNADKRQSVIAAWRHWPELSSRELATRCGVSHTLVDQIRAEPPAVDAPNTPEPPLDPAQTKPNNSNDGEPKKPKKPKPEQQAAKNVTINDATGYPVPGGLVAMWQRKSEVDLLLDAIRQLRHALDKAREENDPLYAEVNFSACDAELDHVDAMLRTAIPHAVCPYCSGISPDNCTACEHRGFMSRYRYGLVEENLKSIRGRFGEQQAQAAQ